MNSKNKNVNDKIKEKNYPHLMFETFFEKLASNQKAEVLLWVKIKKKQKQSETKQNKKQKWK